MEKYKLTNKRVERLGKTLHRIQALKPFGDIKAGELGGYIENERNLSQTGNCWVFDESFVLDNACVSENAYVSGDTRISGNSRISGNARITDKVRISDNSHVSGDVCVSGYVHISGNSHVSGNICLFGDVCVFGNTYLSGEICLFGECRISGDAYLTENKDVLWISNIGSRFGTTTFFRSKSHDILVNCGCFFGTIDEFERRVQEIHGDNIHGRVYNYTIQMAKLQIWKGDLRC